MSKPAIDGKGWAMKPIAYKPYALISGNKCVVVVPIPRI